MNLSIKNAPDELVDRLKLRAERNHRSLQGELMAIIEAAAYAAPRKTPKMTPREIFNEVGKLGLRTQNDPEPVPKAGWPVLMQEWRGVAEMPPFESYRDQLLEPKGDALS